MLEILGLILAAVFGAIFGSYATLFAYRLPLGESCFGRYFGQKSRCPQCNSIIKTRDLVPILNWLFTLGRCRNCQSRIPRTHLFIEFSTTLLFVLSYLKFGFSEIFILYSLIFVGCVILLATDFTHRVFPQGILNYILMIGLVNRVLHEQTIVNIVFSAAVGVVCAVIFYQVFYKKTNGLFANQNQSFDYTKFILIAAACLKISLFLFYFFAVLALFSIILFFNIPSKKNRTNFGYALVVPFIWLMLYPPLSI